MALSDIYQKASLVQIPSGYKSGTLYSVVPNTADGDFTVTGDPEGEATRVNKDGLIETVAANVPRLDYPLLNGVVQDCPALLLEPSRTNNILQSNDPSGANWTDPLSRWTLLSNTTTAPDGGTVRIIELTESGGSLIRLTGLSIAAGTYTVSFYIKDIDGNLTGGNVDIGDEGSGVPSPAFGDVGSDWVRATRTITTTATKSHMDLQPTFSGSTNKVAIWGVQLEAGSYDTSLIPTTTGAVTRTVDKCFNGGDSTLFDLDELTFFVDVTPYKGSTFHYVSLNDGSNQNRIIFIFNDNNTSYTARVISSGSTQLNDTENITFETRNKIAIALKANDTKVYLNGSQVASDTTFTMPVNLDRLNFSIYANSNNFFEGKVHQVMVFNERLSDSELQTLTSN